MRVKNTYGTFEPWRHQSGTVYSFDDGWKVFVLDDNAAHIAWVYVFEPGMPVTTESYRSQYVLESWNERGGYRPHGTFTDTDQTSHQYIEAISSQSPQLAQLWRSVQYDMAVRASR